MTTDEPFTIGVEEEYKIVHPATRELRSRAPLAGAALGARGQLAFLARCGHWLRRFRTGIWRRWPMAGTPQFFASRSEYDALVDTLVKTGSISDATKIYWDVRPSARFETLEFRVTDVCLTIDEAVLIAGLSRALARICYDQAIKNEPALDVRPELLHAAKWRAARYGLEAELIDVADKRAIPGARVD